ncbi:MAG TPA: tRNA pseudouridine(55) synthase TruB [Desulfotomaculum sp.]|nr:MAG: hypothetical protein JL56_13390 [Desulfotomaculum sp. BICA1-6]HBX23766.1 tRNA pseudouridine(55) synthase TruB [Desulfotomaculum sp.]
MNGIISVLKPPGMTSHDVVYYVRKTIGQKKVGHTGTLDPGAAGVLPVCLGKATRIIEYLPDQKKYRAEIIFGRSTTTQDSFGDIIKECYAGELEAGLVEQCLAGFRGSIQQVPPMVSALKHQGKKLYELARAGIEVERKPRTIHIYDLTLVNFINDKLKAPRAIIDVHCSAGTYIRTLCHDLGERIGCGAHMSFLLRTRAGVFPLENTITLEELKDKSINEEITNVMVSMSKALEHLPSVNISGSAVKAVCCGNKVLLPYTPVENPTSAHQVVRIEGPAGLLALAMVNPVAGKPEYRMFQPVKVLI